jgi:hypothetical protein
VYTLSLKDLQKGFECVNRESNKLGKQISGVVIRESMKIRRQDTCGTHEAHPEQEHEIIQEEIIYLQGVDAQEGLSRKHESEEGDEIDENEGMDQPEEEEEGSTPQEAHGIEERDQRGQLQRDQLDSGKGRSRKRRSQASRECGCRSREK